MKNILKQNYVRFFLNYFFNRSKSFYKLKYLIKNRIILFLILRKFAKKHLLHDKVIEVLFFKNYLNSSLLLYSFINIFQSQILIEINSLIFNIKTQIKLSKQTYTKKYPFSLYWVLKKEYVKLKFNKVNFFDLFDKLSFYIYNKKILYYFFKYYQFNKLYLKNKEFFLKIFFIYVKVYFNLFDKFMLYLSKKYYLMLKNTMKKKLILNLPSDSHSFFYARFNTSFLLKVFIKVLYLKQLKKELNSFIKVNMKLLTNDYCLSVINPKKKINFIGFQLCFYSKKLFLKANINKLLVRFFLLNYSNKCKKTFLRFKQLFFYIKLKLVLQSILCYYKYIKNKKYFILQITLILKVFIVKILTKEHFFKSRTQIFRLFKKDFTECRVVWLSYLFWVQSFIGSNPIIPISSLYSNQKVAELA